MDLSMYLRKKAAEAKREAAMPRNQHENKGLKKPVAEDTGVVPKKRAPDAVALQTKARQIELSKKGNLSAIRFAGKEAVKRVEGISGGAGVLMERKVAPKKYTSLDMNKLLGGGIVSAISQKK